MLAQDTDRSAKDASQDDVERLCVVTRTTDRPAHLIRFVAGPDGSITPDLARRLPGRGVWVTATATAVAEAVRSKAFARSLKRQVIVPPDLPELVGRLLKRRFAEAISLANKAGLVTTGFTKIHSRIETGDVAALLHASEAATDGRDKLDRKFRAVRAAAGLPAPVIDELTTDELSLAIGGPNVVHAGLGTGGATLRTLADAGRCSRYRTGLDASEGL